MRAHPGNGVRRGKHGCFNLLWRNDAAVMTSMLWRMIGSKELAFIAELSWRVWAEAATTKVCRPDTWRSVVNP